MSNRKESKSLAMRPALVAKIDALAKQFDLSRSETVSRILGRVIDDLARPEVGWIQIKRSQFEQVLNI